MQTDYGSSSFMLLTVRLQFGDAEGRIVTGQGAARTRSVAKDRKWPNYVVCCANRHSLTQSRSSSSATSRAIRFPMSPPTRLPCPTADARQGPLVEASRNPSGTWQMSIEQRDKVPHVGEARVWLSFIAAHCLWHATWHHSHWPGEFEGRRTNELFMPGRH